MQRIRAAARAAAGWAAEAAGRVLGAVVPALPGVLGPLLVSYGLWRAWEPLGFVGMGTFLLLADRRVP